MFSKDTVVNNFLAFQVLSIFIINASFCFGHYVGVSYEMVSIVCKALVALLFVGVLFQHFKRIPSYVYLFTVATIIVAGLQMALFPQIEQFSSTVVTFYVMCYTSYVVGSLISNASDLRMRILKVSYLCALISVVLVPLNAIGTIRLLNEWGNVGYSMGLGYACTIPAVFLFWNFFEKRKILDLIAALTMVLCIISFGSRGPLLGLGVWIVFYILKNKKGKKGGLVFLIIIAALVFLLFSNAILTSVGGILHSMGIESRTIDLLFSGDETVHMSRRDEFHKVLLAQVNMHPLAIRGINAEYLVLETYAHSIIVEIIYQFGILVGSFILLSILGKSIKTFRLKYNEVTFDIVSIIEIFMITALCQLMVSSSIWILPHFWLWLSLLKSYKMQMNYADRQRNRPL